MTMRFVLKSYDNSLFVQIMQTRKGQWLVARLVLWAKREMRQPLIRQSSCTSLLSGTEPINDPRTIIPDDAVKAVTCANIGDRVTWRMDTMRAIILHEYT